MRQSKAELAKAELAKAQLAKAHLQLPSWQCVMCLWGDKYDVALVNRLIHAIAAHTSRQPRFVLLSDLDRPGLDPRADLRPIPEFWLNPVFRGGGWQPKLAMFAEGVLQADLPALYIDLDTAVTGDLTHVLDKLPRSGGIAVTPCRSNIKPQDLLALPDRGRVTDIKRPHLDLVRFHPRQNAPGYHRILQQAH